jgi:hypothetical protein
MKMTITKKRRRLAAGTLALVAAGTFTLAIWSAAAASGGSRPARAQTAVAHYPTVASIPVLVYHEMDNGCQATSPVCIAEDPETVSTTQFSDEMSYLAHAGYKTVSLSQYNAWLDGQDPRLPAKPVLITADNGIGNFLEGAEPILKEHGFQATAFLVTGFANGAAGKCAPDTVVAGKDYDVQPGCPAANESWDLTWPQLQSLDPSVWSFSLEAGTSGHFVQDYDGTKCQMFDACKIPGESDAAYEARVEAENKNALAKLTAELPGRVTTADWVVPYSDLGYHRCVQDNCTPQPSTGPAGWLIGYAASHFTAAFVEDAYRNGTEHERFRFDINGQDTESYFQQTLVAFTKAGDFRR